MDQQFNFRKELAAVVLLFFLAACFFIQNHPVELWSTETYSFFLLLSCPCLLIYRLQKTAKHYKTSYAALETLTNNTGGSIVTYALDQKLSILYANDGFYKLIGYSRQEVQSEFNNSGLSFMGTDELLEQLNAPASPAKKNKTANFEFELRKKDGSSAWVRANFHRTYNAPNCDTLSYFMMDITDSKLADQALRLEKERYHIATEITNDIIFEYDIAADTLDHSAKYQELFGRAPFIRNFSKDLDQATWVSANTAGALKTLCRDFRSGKPTMSAELKFLDINKQFTWCHIKGKTIYDNSGQPIKVIGKIVNIDAQKKALEVLYHKACRDPLTGLYNKTVTQTLINDAIRSKQPQESHALMIIDIDNFKAVNDNLGHLVGDEILMSMTAQLKTLSGKNDIVGRIGGDEFVVFTSNINSSTAILDKANAISRGLRWSYNKHGKDYAISGSIGISVYPNDGLNYNELLMTADTALYQIKKCGKDNFATASTLEQYVF